MEWNGKIHAAKVIPHSLYILLSVLFSGESILEDDAEHHIGLAVHWATRSDNLLEMLHPS